MPLSIDLKPVESLLFCSEVVAVGTFRCPSSHPLFPDSGPCSHHTFVFPRTATVIRHSGGKPFLATPNCVTLYNQHQEYTRAKISEIDASDWYSVADDVLFAATGRDRRPFHETHVPIDSRTYMAQRRLQESLHDPLEVEEKVLGYVSHSHFTSAFRRQFGMTPSQFRARS